MSLIHKEPYITPDMIDRWESGLKKATDGANALANARKYILLVGKWAESGGAESAMSIYIPVDALESTARYYVVSDAYNTAPQKHMQLLISKSSCGTPQIFSGASAVSSATFEFFYE